MGFVVEPETVNIISGRTDFIPLFHPEYAEPVKNFSAEVFKEKVRKWWFNLK